MAVVYNYLSNVQISIIGEASREIVNTIRDEVYTGGGNFQQQACMNFSIVIEYTNETYDSYTTFFWSMS